MQVTSGNQVHKMCLSLQQWAFLFSIIVFVVTAVLTTCAALGKMHTQDVWELIKADLAEEQEKNYYEYDKTSQLNSNEAKLQLSQHFVLMIIWILYVCTWVGCLNLSAAILMVYGIATKSSIYIIPWILISGTTYLLSISTILVAYLDMLPGIYISFNTLSWNRIREFSHIMHLPCAYGVYSEKNLICVTFGHTVSLASSTVFIVFWYTILLYYTTLTTNSCTSRYPTITPTIIQAYGGYMHTVNPSLVNGKKQIV